jgi:hypothetical protein
VEEVLYVTDCVETVNVAVVASAGTVTEEGTLATAVRLLVRVTTAPAAGAGAFNVTVPAEVFPPRTEVGLSVRALRMAALTLRVELLFAPR